jgi:hypothetical protein
MASPRANPKVLGLANWLLLFLECYRGSSKHLCLANLMVFWRAERVGCFDEMSKGEAEGTRLRIAKGKLDGLTIVGKPKALGLANW